MMKYIISLLLMMAFSTSQLLAITLSCSDATTQEKTIISKYVDVNNGLVFFDWDATTKSGSNESVIYSNLGDYTAESFWDISYTSDGKLYGVIFNILAEINPSDGKILSFETIGDGDYMAHPNFELVGDQDGYLYTVDAIGGRKAVVKFLPSSPASTSLVAYVDTLGLVGEGDLAWSGGFLYWTATTAQGDPSQLVKIDVDSGAVSAIMIETDAGATFTNADSLFNDSKGNLYFAASDTIYNLDKTRGIATSSHTLTYTDGYAGGATTTHAFCASEVPSTSISGTIYDETLANALSNVTVYLYEGNALADTTITDASGLYSFSAADGDYSIVVDSKTIGSYPSVWAQQIASSKGGICSDGSGGTQVALASAGACYGGKRGAVDDDASSLATAEHITQVSVNGGDVSAINFGFSFNGVMNTKDEGQGSFRQFISNANEIPGANMMKFVPTETPNSGTWWTISLSSLLPSLTDAQTTIDGRAYALDGATIRDENSASMSGGIKLGTGSDGVTDTGDEPILLAFDNPELEIVFDSSEQFGFKVFAHDIAIKNLAFYGASGKSDDIYDEDNGNIQVGRDEDANNIVIENNFIGVRADGSVPASKSSAYGINFYYSNSTNFSIKHNYISSVGKGGIYLAGVSVSGGEITQNEVQKVDWFGKRDDGIGIESDVNNVRVFENYVHDNDGPGFESYEGGSDNYWYDNTVYHNGYGASAIEFFGMRLVGTPGMAYQNRIYANKEVGILVQGSDTEGQRIFKNSIYQNGTIGIDLDINNIEGDGITNNNGSMDNNKPNNDMDFPVFTIANTDGITLHLEGYVGSAPSQSTFAVATVEVYKVDANESDLNGEGRYYLGSCSSDASGNINCDIPTSLVIGGEKITATATDTTNSTSEFGENIEVIKIASAIIVAEYRFDECLWEGTAGEVKDSSGNGFDGVALNGANIDKSDGQVNGSGKFIGDNDAVKIEGIIGIDSNNFSLSFWTKIDSDGSATHELLKLENVNASNTTNGDGGVIELRYRESDNELRVSGEYVDGAGLNGYSQIVTTNLHDGAWHHIVLTYVDENMKIYVDTSDADMIHPANGISGISNLGILDAFNGVLRVGNSINGLFNTKVNIDEVKLYDGALSSDEIAEVHLNELVHKNADASDRDAVDCSIPFSCNDTMYFSNKTPVGTVDDSAPADMYLHYIDRSQSPFSFTQIGGVYDDTYNALAYNPKDDFLYATFANNMLRIDSTGEVSEVGSMAWLKDIQADGVNRQHYAATFDAQGYYYLADWASTDTIYKINIETLALEEKIVLSGKVNFIDMIMAQNSGEKVLYMMNRSSFGTEGGFKNQLVKVDLSLKNADGKYDVITIGDRVLDESEVDSLFYDATDKLYLLFNEGGFYEIDIATGKRTAISSAPKLAGLNDGAMCPNATVSLLPTMIIGDASVKEGGDLVFPITLSNNTNPKSFTFKYQAFDGNDSNSKLNAKINVDFTASTFSSGVIQELAHDTTITIPTVQDLDVEADESLHLVLSEITGVLYHDSLAIGKILNDDSNVFSAWDTDEEIVKQIIKTKVVGQSITLNFVKLSPTGDEATTLTDMNETKVRFVSPSVCDIQPSMAGFDESGFEPFVMDKEIATITYTFPVTKAISMREVSVQFYWKDSLGERVSCSKDRFSIRPKKFSIALTPSSGLKAGEDFNITIRALGEDGSPASYYTGVNQAVYALDYNDTKASSGCLRGTLTGVSSLEFTNGEAKLENVNYSEVGELNFTVHELDDEEYAKVDENDTIDSQRVIYNAKADGIEFGASQLAITASFETDATDDFVFYAGHSDSTKDETDEMAAKLKTKVIVKNALGATVTNFRSGCYAQDVKAYVNHSDTSGLIPVLMYDDNTTDTNLSMGDTAPLYYDIKEALFDDGVADSTVKINFQRDASDALNPIVLTLGSVQTTAPIALQSPAVVTDSSKTFIYLRAHIASPQNNVGKDKNVSVEYEVYMDDTINKSVFTGLGSLYESEDSVNWYSINASLSDELDYTSQKALFGGTSMENPNSASGTPSAVGLDTTILYHGASRTSMQIVVPKLPAKNTILYSPTKQYLKYNRHNSNVDTHTFRINFLSDTQQWMGKGDLGVTVDNITSVGNGLQKMDW